MSTVKAAHRESNINNDNNSEISTNPNSISSSTLNIVPRKRRSDLASKNEEDQNNYNNDYAANGDVRDASAMQNDYEFYNSNKKQRYVRPVTTSSSTTLRRHNEKRRQNKQQWRNLVNDDRYYDQWYSNMQCYSSYTPSDNAMSRTAALLSGFSQFGYYEEYDTSPAYYAEAYATDCSASIYFDDHREVIDVRECDVAPVLSRTAKLLSSVAADDPSSDAASFGSLSRTQQLLKAAENPPTNTSRFC